MRLVTSCVRLACDVELLSNNREPGSSPKNESISSCTTWVGGGRIYASSLLLNEMNFLSPDLARLDFIKIDAEGMMIDVLDGARETIRHHLPWCWIEFWKAGIDPIKQHFNGLPYQFCQMPDG